MHAVLTGRERLSSLIQLSNRAIARDGSARGTAWSDLADSLRVRWGALTTQTDRVRSAAALAASMPDSSDREAAIELIVDFAADHLQRDRHIWMSAMHAVLLECREHEVDFAARLARVALRRGKIDRRDIARWTILWVADRLDKSKISGSDLGARQFELLATKLDEHDLPKLQAYVKADGRRGAGRKWLKSNVRALEWRYSSQLNSFPGLKSSAQPVPAGEGLRSEGGQLNLSAWSKRVRCGRTADQRAQTSRMPGTA